MDQQVPVTSRRLRAGGLVAAGLVGGLVLAGLGVARAQSAPDPRPRPGATAPAPPPGDPMSRHGARGHKLGMPGALHGEWTTRAPSGGYQTLAMQVGQVSAVSATSLTVKSEDGYTRTYRVDDGTLVNAGNEGIADVAVGDRVRVSALVANGEASAVEVVDATRVRELRDRWRPRDRRPAPRPTN